MSREGNRPIRGRWMRTILALSLAAVLASCLGVYDGHRRFYWVENRGSISVIVHTGWFAPGSGAELGPGDRIEVSMQGDCENVQLTVESIDRTERSEWGSQVCAYDSVILSDSRQPEVLRAGRAD